MKQFVIFALSLLLSAVCSAQNEARDTSRFSYFVEMAEQSKPIYDTIPCVALVTDCNNCPSRSALLYSVRKKESHWASDGVYLTATRAIRFFHDHYLNERKEPIERGRTVWMSHEKPD
jgi:hypothetical protein